MLTEKEQFIITLSNDCVKASNAIVILEGDYHYRIKKGCHLYTSGFGTNLVFSGGIENLDYGSYPFERVKSYFSKYGVDYKEVILEDKSQNTREQAIEVVDMCLKNNWNKIILVASHFHQYRAFLTFLKILIDRNLEKKIVIYSEPERELKWFSVNDYKENIRFNLLEQEFNKIEQYAQTGHIASYKEAIIYHQWKEKQP